MNIKTTIKDYGFKENLVANHIEGRIPARIIATHKERYEIVCDKGNGFAKIKRGCFYDNPNSIYPTTGDFVLIEWNKDGESMITETLKRESSFSRVASSSDKNHELHKQHEQLVAANFDYVFIMQSLNNNFNLHRLERYLTLSWQSGAIPVIILTKRDLVEDYENYVNQVKNIAIGVDIYGVSCKTGEAIENGTLSQDRFNSYIKLQNEAKYNNDSESYLSEKREKFKNIAKMNKNNKKR